MGVDGAIFAKKRKEFIFIGRWRNLKQYENLQYFKRKDLKKFHKAEAIFTKAYCNKGVSAKEILKFLKLNKKGAKMFENDHPGVYISKKAKKFVKSRMDDEFLFDNDLGPMFDMIEDLGYNEVEFE